MRIVRAPGSDLISSCQVRRLTRRRWAVTASLHTDRTGYISGDMIQFMLKMKNLSSREVDNISLSLVTYQGWHQVSQGDKKEGGYIATLKGSRGRDEGASAPLIILGRGRAPLCIF